VKKSLLSASLSLFLSSILLLTFCSTAPVHAAASWNVQTVDTRVAGVGNGYCPIVVDSNNMPSIAYTDRNMQDGLSVMYARWNSSYAGLITQRIAPGYATDMILDAHDNPNILYRVIRGGLWYASWTGLNWTIQTVDTTTPVYAALALDSHDNPHAAYSTGQTLKYASRSGSTWTIEIVDNGTDIPIHLSLALDSNDKPYILYSNQDWKLATLENSGWNIQNVPLPAYSYPDALVSVGNMVLDSTGHPHLIYSIGSAGGDDTIKYARWNGFYWETQTVASGLNLEYIGNLGFLALDSLDYPHISYVISGFQLMYAGWTGVDWSIQTVDSVGARSPVYLAVDSNRIPHISVRTGSTGLQPMHLMYATASEPVPLASPLLITLPLLLVLTAVVIGAAVFVVYLWKKKT